MADIENVIKGLESLYKSMHENQCYACSHEFIETANEFGTEIIADALELLEKQQQKQQIVRCKDCKKRYTVLCIQEEAGNINNQDDWFCADGEKKE